MIKTISEINDEVLKTATASEIIKAHKLDLDSEITRISQEWETKKNKSENDMKDAQAKTKELEDKFSKATENLNKVQDDLTKLIEANKLRDQEEAFSARMEYFNNEYDLDEKTKNIVANKIKGLDDAGYTTEKESLEVLLAAKKKGFVPFVKKDEKEKPGEKDSKKEEMDEEKAKKSCKASVETGKESATAVDDALENGEKKQAAVAATTTPAETIGDKWKSAFGVGQWEINPRHVRK